MKRLLPLAVAVAAANVSAERTEIEHVLISVPLHKKTAETALPITVLSGDELKRLASSTLGDTLNATPGLANASFGPGVGQPVIRGQQGARVTVLQNGTSSADASNLSADHAVSVEPLLADSIEVLRGPSTLLYGGGAIGGVVNVLDNRIPTSLPAEPAGGLEYRHDSASDMDNVTGRFESSSGNFAVHADVMYRDWSDLEIPGYASLMDDHEEHDHDHDEDHDDDHDEDHEDHDEEHSDEERRGVLGNTGGRTKSLTLGSSYHFEDGFFGFAVNRLENTYGIPAGAHVHHGDDDHDEDHDEHEGEEDHDHEEHDEHGHGDGVILDVEQTRYDAALHWHNPAPGMEVLRGFLTYTDYEHKEIEGSGEVGTTYANDTWEGRLEMVHETVGNFHGVFGLQMKSSEFSALGEEAFIPVTDSDEIGLFLVEDYHRGDWTFEFGARFDHDKRDPDSAAARSTSFNALSASASVLWNLAPGWQLGAAASIAERAPTIEELYSNVEAQGTEQLVVHAATNAIEIGDASLETETSNNLDLSLNWQGSGHFVSVTAFYNDFHDYIGLMDTGEEVDEVIVYAYDQEDAEFYGLEVDAEFTLASLASGDLRLGLFGDLIRGEFDSSEDVPRLPPQRIGGRLSWTSDSWSAWGQVIDAGEQDRAGVNEAETDGYTRWDAGIDYRLPVGSGEWVTFVNFNNITDEEIRLSTSFLRQIAPEAGRSIEAGIRFTF